MFEDIPFGQWFLSHSFILSRLWPRRTLKTLTTLRRSVLERIQTERKMAWVLDELEIFLAMTNQIQTSLCTKFGKQICRPRPLRIIIVILRPDPHTVKMRPTSNYVVNTSGSRSQKVTGYLENTQVSHCFKIVNLVNKVKTRKGNICILPCSILGWTALSSTSVVFNACKCRNVLDHVIVNFIHIILWQM